MRAAALWFSNNIGARELVLVAGLALVAFGLAQLSTAAALIVPGAILVYLAIPPATPRKKGPTS